MIGRTDKNDGRLRCWLPESVRWIREALSHAAAHRESEEGVPSSASMEMVKILERELGWFVGRKPRKVLRIEFREKDEWVYDEVLKLVEAKRAMGIKDVTINFEAARLMKAALLGSGKGASV